MSSGIKKKENKLKIVCDTNILVSSIISDKGYPAAIIEAVCDGKLELFLSPDILNEFKRVLMIKLSVPEKEIGRYLFFFKNISVITYPIIRVDHVKADPDDNRVLECALAAGADLVVTGDKKHLLPIGSFRGVKILSARDLYKSYL